MRAPVALLVLAFLSACAEAEIRVYSPSIEVPATPEAQACRRECLALSVAGQACAARMYGVEADGTQTLTIVSTGVYAMRDGCPGLVADCLLTCPGSKEIDGGPHWVRDRFNRATGERVGGTSKKRAKPEPAGAPDDAFPPSM